MMVLFDNNGHLGTILIDAYDGNRLGKDAAFLKLFKLYDAAEFYGELDDVEAPLYKAAKEQGDVEAAYKLLSLRKKAHAEYEDGWRFETVYDPDDE